MAKKRLIILLALLVLIAVAVAFLRSSGATAVVWQFSDQGRWLLPLVAVSAILDSVNPCAFSVLILTIAFLMSIGSLRSKILRLGGVYILGIFSVYLLIGLGLLRVLHLFNTPHFMGRLGAALLIVLGAVNLINEFFPRFPIKFRLPAGLHHALASLMDKASMPAVFALGVLVGLCEFPCTGGPYLMVIGLLHDRATYLPGVGYLAFYNLIFILPLVALLLLASDKSLQAKVEAWQKQEKRTMRFVGGALMVLLGIIIFFI